MPPVASLLATPGQSFEDAKKHWAYQPITNLSPPMVKNSSRVQSPIDAFLLEKLEAQNLTFAPPADKRTLRRRVFYDLIGLPPPPEEIRAFEREGSRNAFAKVADRLLASPGYGERWGRHWLAAARYAATKDPVLACGQDALRPFAYTYRDYVIHLPEPFEPYIFKRGNSSRLGQAVPRAFLTVLSDGQLSASRLPTRPPTSARAMNRRPRSRYQLSVSAGSHVHGNGSESRTSVFNMEW